MVDDVDTTLEGLENDAIRVARRYYLGVSVCS